MRTEIFAQDKSLAGPAPVCMTAPACAHCGTRLDEPARLALKPGDTPFCCRGCRMVFAILSANGLGRYYELRGSSGDPSRVRPVALSSETYAYLDDPAFLAKYSQDNGRTMDFYLEGVHCTACLWLVEKLPRLVPGLEDATLDIGRAVARLRLAKGGSFRPAARMLEELGYRPHAVEHDEAASKLQLRENRASLIRIGVAGACTGNIMLMAVPLYGGLDHGVWAVAFRWLSLIFFLPIALYAAVPFYRSSWASLKTRTMSIDLPIVLALAFGAGAGIAHLLSGSEHIYFDSLSALVFLLLASRHVLRRMQQKALAASRLFQFLSPSRARRVTEAGATIETAAEALRAHDVIRVENGEALPADGRVRSGSGVLNCALLTGESLPVAAAPGTEVFAGTVFEGASLDLEVTAAGRETRLGKILGELERGAGARPAIVAAADRTAKWFLAAVFLAAAASIFAAPTLAEGFSRALALVIVTCPCALALATPLAMSVALGRASREGLLIKSAETLERIHRAREIALDKTGTLTTGHFELLDWTELEPTPGLVDAAAGPAGPALPASRIKEAVVALERRSRHPVAQALVKSLEPRREAGPLPVPTEFRELAGRGVEGVVGGHRYELRALRSGPGTTVGVNRDGVLVAAARLGDRLRPETESCLERLAASGLVPYVVSGDNASAVRAVADKLGLASGQVVAEASPELKSGFVKSHPHALMVGDGANDALALSQAYVGIAVHGSMEVSLRAADVYLTTPGLEPVVKLVGLAHSTMHTIYRNFAFSLLYNVVGGLAAATGHITPLAAAILMPLSAFTVFISSLRSRP